MSSKSFVLWLVAATVVAATLTTDVLAQVLRRNRTDDRAPATTPPSDSGQIETRRDLRDGPLRRQSEVLRSSKIIGIEVFDRNNQLIGTVQDVLINYQGRCPTAFASIIAANDSYVVPLTVLQFGPLDQAGKSRATLAMKLNDLRNAPRLETGNDNLLGDGRFLSRVSQFFDRIERMAARLPLEDRDNRAGGRTQGPPAPGDDVQRNQGEIDLQRRNNVPSTPVPPPDAGGNR